MFLENMKVMDGNCLLSYLEETNYFEDWCEPAPDGYTRTINKKEMEKLAEQTKIKELEELAEKMEDGITYVLYFD